MKQVDSDSLAPDKKLLFDKATANGNIELLLSFKKKRPNSIKLTEVNSCLEKAYAKQTNTATVTTEKNTAQTYHFPSLNICFCKINSGHY